MFKFDTKLFYETIQSYSKTASYLRFKTCQKLFFIQNHENVKIRWAPEYLRWTLEDWMRIIWINNVTFETELNTQALYITCCPGTTMESQYLKLIYKREQTTLGKWKTITFEKRDQCTFEWRQKFILIRYFDFSVFCFGNNTLKSEKI